MVGYLTYGVVRCSFLGDVKTGYNFGKLALNLLNRFNATEFKSQILAVFSSWIQHHQEALRAMMPTSKDGYMAGMETGDFLYAGYSILVYFHANFFGGVELDAWESEITGYSAAFTQMKQYSVQTYLGMNQQVVRNLKETLSQPDCLIGNAYDETVMIPKHYQNKDQSLIAWVYIYKLLLAYSFGNCTAAIDYIAQVKPCLMAVSGLYAFPIFHFYAALTYLALFSTYPENEQTEILAQVETHQTTLQQWEQNAPMNYLHKWYLVEAEKQRVLANKAEAIDFYDRAISLAKENQFLNEEALANELAAKFYLEWGKEKFAQIYMLDAYYCYLQWGATAKVKDLETRYPQLLQAIQPRNKNTKATASATTTASDYNLDITTVMKAYQAISGEIMLDKLLSNVMKILIENAGAQKGYLILSSQGKLLIEASHNSQNETIDSEKIAVLQSIPVDNCQEIPSAIVNYVARTQENVVLDDAVREGQFTNDAYIQKHQPKSILCVPLINQSQLVSIVYLENNLTAGAFTPERVELLKVLSGQAAISIQNSKLYTEVRENERKLTQFLEAMPVGVGILDASGNPYYTNRVAQELLGKGVIPDATSQDIAEVYQLYKAGTEEEYASTELPLVRALNGESTTADDIEIHQGKKIIPIEAWGSPIYDEKNNIVYAMVAFQDITERKKAEAERIKFTNELAQLNQAYERFVPNQFLQFLQKSSIIDVKLGDQVQLEMSVLFADIRDFTMLSERMTPEDNFKFINSYLSRMEPVINQNHGFIDKYIGDAIMALFSGEADNAVQAGIAMLNQLVEYNQRRANSGYAPIQIGIGINTGNLMLGTVGGQNRMEGTVISDAVNLAARVESLTKNYGMSLLITQETYLRLKNPFQYAIRAIDTVKVRGKSELVTIYEVFDGDLPEIKAGKLATRELFAEALANYSAGKFAEAGQLFAKCWRLSEGDRPAKIYWERCELR
jgi:PAS domain S-box-containing protein